jgi:hypothetical protein
MTRSILRRWIAFLLTLLTAALILAISVGSCGEGHGSHPFTSLRADVTAVHVTKRDPKHKSRYCEEDRRFHLPCGFNPGGPLRIFMSEWA